MYLIHTIVSKPGGGRDDYAFIQDVPANEEIYAKIQAELGDVAPAGLIAHLVVRRPDGLRYIDVWQRRRGLGPLP